eukprot:gene1406-1428_t
MAECGTDDDGDKDLQIKPFGRVGLAHEASSEFVEKRMSSDMTSAIRFGEGRCGVRFAGFDAVL